MSTEREIVAMFHSGLRVAEIAAREGVSRPTIYLILHRNDVALRKHERREPKATREPKVKVPRRLRADGGALRRFVNYKAEPARVMGLSPQHPAAVKGRTLFPSTVTGVFASPRFLVDGKNNAKIGGKVLKGAWAGMPVYTLTLQERATCPKACAQWLTCYGNSLQWPRRNDASDPDFMPALAAEVITKAREHPAGFVVRLHVLGDFFSVAYVRMWAHLLDMLPMLRCYGYTARRVDDETDAESRLIAAEIAKLTEARWDRFAIRTSHSAPGRDRTIVVMAPVDDPAVVMCPSQTEATQTCGTCAICWSPAARDKTVAFLLHGMKR